MIFGIPSFKRPECRTIETLLSAGVEESKIFVSLQEEEDLPAYKEKHPGVNYLFRRADCAAGNRNTIVELLEDRPLCLLDDDIVSFSTYDEHGKFITNTERGIKKIEETCSFAQQNGISIAGVAPTNSNIIARGRKRYSVDVVLQGSVLIFTKNGIFFDDRYKMVEDYELCLREMCKGGRTIRNNYVCANKPKNGTNKGGMHERYENGELPFWIDFLAKVYPMFVPNKNKTGGSVKWR